MNAPQFPLEGERHFSIGRIAELCGTTPSTLRSWERRYGFPSPPRRDSGHRVYTRHEMELVRQVVERIHHGASASNAIEDVRKLVAESADDTGGDPAQIRALFVESVQALDSSTARQCLRQAWEVLDWSTVAAEFIAPAMIEIGDRWHAGQLSVAAEHMATALVRQQIIAFIRFLGDAEDGPIGVAACAPDENHDLGLLLLAATMRRRGWRVIYLGQNVPVDELVTATVTAGAYAAFISATTEQALRSLHELPSVIADRGAAHVQFVVGGQALQAGDEPWLAGAVHRVAAADVGRTLEELERSWWKLHTSGDAGGT